MKNVEVKVAQAVHQPKNYLQKKIEKEEARIRPLEAELTLLKKREERELSNHN